MLSWIGTTDIEHYNKRDSKNKYGPFMELINCKKYSEKFDEIHLLYNNDPKIIKEIDNLTSYLQKEKKIGKKLKQKHFNLNDNFSYKDIFGSVQDFIKDLINTPENKNKKIKWHFNLGPGTKPMTAIFILLGKCNYDAEFYGTKGIGNDMTVEKIDIPFEIEYTEKIEKLLVEKNADIEKNIEILRELDTYKKIKFRSEKMAKILHDEIPRFAPGNVTVFIYGETGTGKENIARLIHDFSERKNNKFTTVNCAAIPAELLESELFGYVKGAFTGALKDTHGMFEKSDGGTIFLDEIGEMSLPAQTRLLRVLQEKEISRVGEQGKIHKVDVRVIAATNKNLFDLVNEKKFREDLYFRVCVLNINLPPLRERDVDVFIIAQHYLNEYNKLWNKDIQFSKEVKGYMRSYSWPGNIRELINTVERACRLSDKNKITIDNIKTSNFTKARTVDIDLSIPTDLKKEKIYPIVKEYIFGALKLFKNQEKAAEYLGFESYQTMFNQLDEEDENYIRKHYKLV